MFTKSAAPAWRPQTASPQQVSRKTGGGGAAGLVAAAAAAAARSRRPPARLHRPGSSSWRVGRRPRRPRSRRRRRSPTVNRAARRTMRQPCSRGERRQSGGMTCPALRPGRPASRWAVCTLCLPAGLTLHLLSPRGRVPHANTCTAPIPLQAGQQAPPQQWRPADPEPLGSRGGSVEPLHSTHQPPQQAPPHNLLAREPLTNGGAGSGKGGSSGSRTGSRATGGGPRSQEMSGVVRSGRRTRAEQQQNGASRRSRP